MSQPKYRLLEPACVPNSLWDPASETLLIAPSLANAYRLLIDRHSLLALSASRDPNDPPVGGASQERTDQYFAQAFDGSAARTQLALLDPKESASLCSNALVSSLAGGRLSLTDAPCGAAAAALALLSTIAELRSQQVVPRMPLDVFLIGGELSEPARKYAASMLDELRAPLEEQAIFVQKVDFLPWDVTDKLSPGGRRVILLAGERRPLPPHAHPEPVVVDREAAQYRRGAEVANGGAGGRSGAPPEHEPLGENPAVGDSTLDGERPAAEAAVGAPQHGMQLEAPPR